ncbi:MAG: branched-chain amino acid ABC transporter permease [Desulfarculaceae bacterium]|nr:branched-chain amino acid ABC transporter permease [Desulfarculaceae bacterium]MCF8074285.1 branched-chain amino acid ABC transporter permease [Desulfarculaceae bacterium]MCF8103353.1 branched-chain amino acid ABC transporter permease [Desulfarculaceae bacterium]MCF8117857.1 branched-chain amino acid ABC transporter permease [Desulfarculaceae bacterium]
MAAKQKIWAGLGLVACLALPLIITDRYIQHLLVMSLIFVIFSSSWNLITGYSGQLNMGHAAFFGIGAYASALLALKLGVSPWIGMFLGGLLAAAAGFLLGIPALRLSGPYLAITTIGFAEILRLVAMNWVDLTRGSLGLYGIPPLPGFWGIRFTSELTFYYVALAAAAWALFCFRRITRSEFGLSLQAMREDEIGAESIGIGTNRYKLTVFTISAFFGGFAGALLAHYQRLISPDMLSLGETFQALTMTMIGGLGTLTGPVIGAVLLTFLSEGLRFVEDAVKMDVRLIIYGGLLIVTILFMRGGIMGLWERWRGRSAGDGEEA